MITHNAHRVATRQVHRTSKYLKEVGEAVKENTRLVYKKARQFSNQRFYSLDELRRMGHPYARRDPRPPVAAHIINRQSARFYRSWRWNWIRTSNMAQGTIWNQAPYSKYMEGTEKMIRRPILDRALDRTKAARDRNVKNARRRGYYRVTGN